MIASCSFPVCLIRLVDTTKTQKTQNSQKEILKRGGPDRARQFSPASERRESYKGIICLNGGTCLMDEQHLTPTALRQRNSGAFFDGPVTFHGGKS